MSCGYDHFVSKKKFANFTMNS